MDFIKKNAVALVALIIAIVSLIGFHSSKLGQITDTSFMDYFDATTGFRLAGTTFYNSSGLSIATPITTTSSTLNVGNVANTYSRTVLTSGTSTPCAIQSPAATTTLAGFTYQVTTATSSATYYDFATSTTAYATTSVFASRTYAGGVQFTAVVSSGADWTVSPSTYVVAKGSAASPVTSGGIVTAGTCTAVFRGTN